ncbi:uncharacterized protein EDB93DRAFT_1122890 [Suillus bovinus]|uniref:uncharacterized protein n=1 Tax=Suillus bovinus TaxID=48563 RepID=UPI001B85CB7D|nr:uncharacterized protein EDB93DRAFT_1122890 [Suillus bovinus]KAG2158070.1 hypothetical protein EDB93DRAFT_1122890 [Suillus bovinus]
MEIVSHVSAFTLVLCLMVQHLVMGEVRDIRIDRERGWPMLEWLYGSTDSDVHGLNRLCVHTMIQLILLQSS